MRASWSLRRDENGRTGANHETRLPEMIGIAARDVGDGALPALAEVTVVLAVGGEGPAGTMRQKCRDPRGGHGPAHDQTRVRRMLAARNELREHDDRKTGQNPRRERAPGALIIPTLRPEQRVRRRGGDRGGVHSGTHDFEREAQGPVPAIVTA